MGAPDAIVFDVDLASFGAAVVDRSFETPVLVDFWAPWCGPCLQLSPVLEAVVRARAGELVLAKVDTQAQPQLGAQHGVATLPTVKLWFGGRVVADFVGALSGGTIGAFVGRHLPSPADREVARARAAAQRGQWVVATASLQAALRITPEHEEAHAWLGRAALVAGDEAALRRHLAAVGPYAVVAPQVQALARAWELRTDPRTAGGALTHRSALSRAPHDARAHFGLGGCLVAQGRFAEAVTSYLWAAQHGAGTPEGADARAAVGTICTLLGDDDPVAIAAHARLRELAGA